MKRSELIKKWKGDLELYKKIISQPLIYDKEQRIKASSKSLTIASMLVDIEELNSLD